jgi:hypothetical protein
MLPGLPAVNRQLLVREVTGGFLTGADLAGADQAKDGGGALRVAWDKSRGTGVLYDTVPQRNTGRLVRNSGAAIRRQHPVSELPERIPSVHGRFGLLRSLE